MLSKAEIAALGVVFVLLVAAFVAVAIVIPLVVIWALNTLFGLGIGYTLWNWLAMLILLLMFWVKIPAEWLK